MPRIGGGGDFGRFKEIRQDRQAKKVQAVIDAKSPPGLTACVLQACERNNHVRVHRGMYVQTALPSARWRLTGYRF